ncbi:MAG: metallophosphoesterase [Clostridia bacterium]|nr:metallophosphoesterase [Clostridia bacterium]
MSLFALADLHLSTLASTNKSMEVFGNRWQDYMLRLRSNWERLVSEGDTVIIPGDVSWALSLEESLSDMRFIDALPGKKILGKGNHDFWWSTMNKHSAFFEKNNIKTISFLFNNAHIVENYIIAGTRGWYQDEDARNAPKNADFEKLINRENLRLRASLSAARTLKEENPEKEILCFMHFPPYWNEKAADGLIEALKEYEIKRLYFGHIHGNYTCPPSFIYEGIEMTLVSADYLGFIPKIIK